MAKSTTMQDLIDAAEIAYSEMAFALQDIMVPDRRKDDAEWSARRGTRLARAADELRAAIDEVNQ